MPNHARHNAPAVAVSATRESGELCKSGKPCVRRKGHSINKRWQHMDSLAPKKQDKAQTVLVHGFVNCGPIEIVRMEE